MQNTLTNSILQYCYENIRFTLWTVQMKPDYLTEDILKFLGFLKVNIDVFVDVNQWSYQWVGRLHRTRLHESVASRGDCSHWAITSDILRSYPLQCRTVKRGAVFPGTRWDDPLHGIFPRCTFSRRLCDNDGITVQLLNRPWFSSELVYSVAQPQLLW